MYTYRCPTEDGFRQIKIPRKIHKLYIDAISWSDTYEYYFKEDYLLIHRFNSLPVKILLCLFSPLSFLLNGIINARKTSKDLYGDLFQKKTGSFVPNYYRRHSGNSLEMIKLFTYISDNNLGQ